MFNNNNDDDDEDNSEKNKFFNKDDYESFKEKLFEIIDLQDFSQSLRKASIVHFNERYKSQGITLKVKNDVSEEYLEDIIQIEEVIEIITERLEPKEDFKQHQAIIGNNIISATEKISERIFYSVCNKLVDTGVMEMLFDAERNEFAWRYIGEKKPKRKYKKKSPDDKTKKPRKPRKKKE